MKATELRIEFPRPVNEYQRKMLVVNLQSLRAEFGKGLSNMRSKVRNPMIEVALRANSLSKDTLNSAIDSLLATGEDGKPLYYKFFVLESEDMTVFRFTYMDVSDMAAYFPFFGVSVKSLSAKKAEAKIKQFIVMSAQRGGFTERSIKIEKVSV